jgi:hypothetical protein
MKSGLLRAGQELRAKQNGIVYNAVVSEDGNVLLPDGRIFESPSSAGAAALQTKACNGWHFWQAETSRGSTRLSRLREDLLERKRATVAADAMTGEDI